MNGWKFFFTYYYQECIMDYIPNYIRVKLLKMEKYYFWICFGTSTRSIAVNKIGNPFVFNHIFNKRFMMMFNWSNLYFQFRRRLIAVICIGQFSMSFVAINRPAVQLGASIHSIIIIYGV